MDIFIIATFLKNLEKLSSKDGFASEIVWTLNVSAIVAEPESFLSPNVNYGGFSSEVAMVSYEML